MQYVIVRTIRSIVLDEQADTVAIVYGPFDEQGCSAAYKKLVAAGLAEEPARLHVRGLFPTGDSPLQRAGHEARDALITKALGIGPGETLRIDLPEDEA